MNILFVLQRYPGFGGIEIVTYNLAKEFIKQFGYNITIFSTSFQDVPNQLLDSPLFKFITTASRARELKTEFDQIVKIEKPDIIIYQDSYVEEYFLIKSIPQNIRIIVCEHNTPDALEIGLKFVTKQMPISLGNIWRKIRLPYRLYQQYRISKTHHQKLYDACDRYVLLSETYREVLQKKYGIYGEKVCAIPNLVSTSVEFVKKKDKVMLFIARLTQQKGINYLMEIWEKLESKCDWELVVVGDGDLHDWLRDKIIEKGFTRVRLEGFKSDVYSYFDTASIHLMTSVYEGFGITNVEAMAHGVIPFAFNSFSSIIDIIDDGQNGFIIPAFNTSLYANRILEFIKLPELVKDGMRVSAIEKAKKFSPDNIIRKWDALFRELMDS